MSLSSTNQRLTAQLTNVVTELFAAEQPHVPCPPVYLMAPRQEAFGDYSCNVAMVAAKMLGKPTRHIAQAIVDALGDAEGMLATAQVAGPGFINFRLKPACWEQVLVDVASEGEQFLASAMAAGKKLLLEFVSANPTGPLHVAHARGAAVGDVLAKLLKLVGYQVDTEYYINDLGKQTEVLAASVFWRYQQCCGVDSPAPEEFYPGEYIEKIANSLLVQHGQSLLQQPTDRVLEQVRQSAMATMMHRIQDDLQTFGVQIKQFVSEQTVCDAARLAETLQALQQKKVLYQQDGKLWFRSTDYGDDKDRVLIREDGRPTYFASDIVYHHHKMQRGYTQLINIWGADHGGYVARVQAALQALGASPELLRVILVQMVSVSRDGAAVRMGKRLGTAVWLRDVVDEAGADATRYLFLLRRVDAQMDFNLDVACQKSLDNPVYYAQMGHARLCAILRKAHIAGIASELSTAAAMACIGYLRLPEEQQLLKLLAKAPEVIQDAATALEPHGVVAYLQRLVGQFHSYYTQYRHSEKIISDNLPQSHARVQLCAALALVLRSLLTVVGVQAPETMSLTNP